MKRRISSFTKMTKEPIPGLSGTGQTDVFVGMACPSDPMNGGGFVAEMEFTGAAILIRKRNFDGTPCRSWGTLSRSGPNIPIQISEGDGIMIPFIHARRVVFEDVEEREREKQKTEEQGEKIAPPNDPPPAKPIQAQPKK
jgi:hypothetical protein